MKSIGAFKRDQSGLAYAAVVAFAGLMIIAITWNILGPMMSKHIFAYAENEMKEDGTWEEYGKNPHTLIVFIWNYWPLFLLGAYIVFMYLASQQPSGGYYGG